MNARWIVLTVLLSVGGGFVGGFAAHYWTTRSPTDQFVQSLSLVGKDGHMLAQLAVDQRLVSSSRITRDGETVLADSVYSELPRLGLYDASGQLLWKAPIRTKIQPLFGLGDYQ